MESLLLTNGSSAEVMASLNYVEQDRVDEIMARVLGLMAPKYFDTVTFLVVGRVLRVLRVSLALLDMFTHDDVDGMFVCLCVCVCVYIC